MGQPDVDIGGAVDAGIVVVAGRTVDVGRKGAGGGGAGAVLEVGRGGAGNEVEQALEVAVAGQGEGGDLFAVELGANVGFFGLEDGGGAADGDLFGDVAYLEADIGASHGIDDDGEFFAGDRAKAAGGDAQGVGAGEDVDEGVAAVGVAFAIAAETGFFTDELHRGVGHGGIAGVEDGTDDGAVEYLGMRLIEGSQST